MRRYMDKRKLNKKERFRIPRETKQKRQTAKKRVDLVMHATYLALEMRRLYGLNAIKRVNAIADELQEILLANPFLKKKHAKIERSLDWINAQLCPWEKLFSDEHLGNS